MEYEAWDDDLADDAQKWANNGDYSPSGFTDESLTAGPASLQMATKAWYYQGKLPGKDMKSFGCGISKTANGRPFYVCRYTGDDRKMVPSEAKKTPTECAGKRS